MDNCGVHPVERAEGRGGCNIGVMVGVLPSARWLIGGISFAVGGWGGQSIFLVTKGW